MSDLRGLTEKGKKDYPRFSRNQIETRECEICKGIRTVKKYKIIRKDYTEVDIFLCDTCCKVTPKGVFLIPYEKPVKAERAVVKEEEKEFDQGDTLLI